MNYDSLRNIKDNSSYYEFLDIDHDAHHEKVRYYEDNLSDISSLDFDHRMYVWCDYALSVFEIGRYQEYIKLSDELIPIVISENIFHLRDIDIYKALLFRKGASLYNIQNFDEAEYIFSQLCKMDVELDHKKAWKQTMYKILKSKMRTFQAISVLLFIFTAVIIAIELLIVRNFYMDFTNTFEFIRIGTFLLGVGTLGGIELYVKLKTEHMFKTKIKQ